MDHSLSRNWHNLSEALFASKTQITSNTINVLEHEESEFQSNPDQSFDLNRLL